MYKINKNIGVESISFSIIHNDRIALAELSLFDKSILEDILNEADSNTQYRDIFLEAENVWFFNRLNVPEKIRKNGIGTFLLKALNEHFEGVNDTIINTVNSYGDLSQKDLVSYYEKNGFLLIDSKNDILLLNSKVNDKILLKNSLNNTKFYNNKI